jgi:hypothetical protein
MKTLTTVIFAAFLSAAPARAKGKDFQDGLTKEEVTKLTKSLGALEAKYTEAKPSIEKLKKNPDVRRTPKLTIAASEVLKSYATIGVFLHEMDQGLKKRDPKVNSFEIQLKSEITQYCL